MPTRHSHSLRSILAMATTKVLRQGRLCINDKCHWASVVPGFRDSGPESDDAQFERAIRLAWENRASLAPRDLALLEALRGAHWPVPRSAREIVGDFERAVVAAPDRADTQYLLGLLLLYQGPAIGRTDALAQAAARFRNALELDSVYIAPLARLVDVAAYQRDTASLRRYGAMYLTRDSAGATADFVRWRMAVGTNDAATLRQIRARFNSLDLATLTQIVTASQMTGNALEDADRASTLIIDRTTAPGRSHVRAVLGPHARAQPRATPPSGQPAAFAARDRRVTALLPSRHDMGRDVWRWRPGRGRHDGAGTSRFPGPRHPGRARAIAHPPQPVRRVEINYRDALSEVNQEALWRWAHGSPKTAADLARWMRRHGDAVRRRHRGYAARF